MNYLTPKEKRYLSDLTALVHQRRVALFLGAGIDHAICNNMLSWRDLVRFLIGYDKKKLPDCFVDKNIQILPTVAMHRMGDAEFTLKIQKVFNNSPKNNSLETTKYCDALKKLAKHIPLVVTTNYSNIAYLSLGDNRPIVELNTLKSVRVPDAGSKRNLFVYLHGRTETPVLDANGYRSAEYGEVLYYEFLRDLLLKWTVLFCGASFDDPPLRAASAQVKQRYPEISHHHFLVKKQKKCDESEPELRFYLERLGMSLSYDVQTIRIENYEDLPKVWERIDPVDNNGSSFLPYDEIKNKNELVSNAINHGNFEGLADFLDQSGDYESSSQRFLSYEFKKNKNLCKIVKQFEKKVADVKDGTGFITLLRVERHLRHMLYLAGGSFPIKRKELWCQLLKVLDKNKTWLNCILHNEEDNRLLADYYFGFHETVGNNKKCQSDVLKCIEKILTRDIKYKERVCIAKKAWNQPNAANERDIAILRSRAFDAGWESLDAKLSIDTVRARILKIKDGSKPTAKEIDNLQALCSQAKSIAKVAGNMRRHIAALLYSALWTPDSTQAKAGVRAAAELSLQDGKPMVEKSLWDGVCWVWYVLNDSENEALKMLDPDANLSKFEKEQKKFYEKYNSPFYS